MNMAASLSFDNINDTLPPFEAEAEESILGGILSDLSAIHRIKDILKPEHFFFPAHQHIYSACLSIAQNGSSTDLLTVESYLKANNLFEKIGGVNKTRSLLYSCISTVNIDALADLVIDKAARRAVISVGDEIKRLGYSVKDGWDEIVSTLEKKIKLVTEGAFGQTKEQSERAEHDRLLKDITEIYTTCAEPSFRYFKLKLLGDSHKVSTKFLDTLYLKSLASQCSDRLTYEQLKEMAGGNIREWLINGLIPKKTTICLVADGGVGKTKYAYSLGKTLIQGSPFGIFHPTGEKRKILYYQGDESQLDMYQALETLGYSEQDIGEYVRVRFGWSFENMPILFQDLEEFKPDFIVIDSLSSANRLSIFKEGEMEYARPLLELSGLSSKYDCTFLVIHHTNKGGEVRGSTAIRNSVSEFWKLSQPTDATSNTCDRLLEIDKSRSRSCKKKYRLHFDPDSLNFTFLGEEGAEHSNSDNSLKRQILDFFAAHRKTYYTAIEISHELDSDKGHTRNTLTELKNDGLLSVIQTPGFANKYFLDFDGGGGGLHYPGGWCNPLSTPGCTPESTVNTGTSANDGGGAPQEPENLVFQGAPEKTKKMEVEVHPPGAPLKPSEIKESEGALRGCTTHPKGAPLDDFLVEKKTKCENEPKNEVFAEPTEPKAAILTRPKENTCPRTGLPMPNNFTHEIDSPLGISSAAVTFKRIQNDHKTAFSIDFKFANGITKRKSGAFCKSRKELIQFIETTINETVAQAIKHPSRRYKVQQLRGTIQNPEVVWISGCQCIRVPEQHSNWWVFQARDHEIFQVAGDKEFILEIAD